MDHHTTPVLISLLMVLLRVNFIVLLSQKEVSASHHPLQGQMFEIILHAKILQ